MRGQRVLPGILSGALVLTSGLFAPSGLAQRTPKGLAQSVREHLERAQKAQQEGEVHRAESEYRQALGVALNQLGGIYNAFDEMARGELAYRGAIEAIADSEDAVIGLGVVYLRSGQIEKGLETAQIILAQKPYHARARHLLGKLYFLAGRLEAASQQLQEASRLAPGDFSVAYTLALAYLRQKRLEPARKIFDSMLKALGDSPQLHILFGRAYRETEFLQEAIAEFRRVVALNPTYPRVHYYLGLTYLLMEGTVKLPEASKEFLIELERNPNEYLANYYLGIVYLTEHKLPEALKYLEKAAELNPQNPDPYAYWGQALSHAGQYERAVPVLEKAIALTPDPSVGEYKISSAHYLLGQALIRLGKTPEGRKHLAVAQEYKSKSAQMAEERLAAEMEVASRTPPSFASVVKSTEGAILVTQEPPTQSERAEMKKMEDFYPKVAGNAYNQLGLLEAGRGNFARAADHWERAARWQPDLPDLDYNLGLACFRAQDYRRALPPLERAHTRQPDRLPVRVLLGLSHFFVNDYVRAVEQLGPLADAAANDPQVMYALGLSLVNVGERQRGEQILRRLVENNPQAAELHLGLGQALAMSGDYGAAASEFLKALEINPALPEAHYYAGLALLRQSKFDEAADEFRMEAARNPRHAKAQYHLGFCLIAMRQVEEGIQKIEEALRLNPSYAPAYYQVGKVRLQQGRLQEAVASLEKAVLLDPDKSYVQYQLSQAYLKAGRRDAATTALARYRDLKARERTAPRDSARPGVVEEK